MFFWKLNLEINVMKHKMMDFYPCQIGGFPIDWPTSKSAILNMFFFLSDIIMEPQAKSTEYLYFNQHRKQTCGFTSTAPQGGAPASPARCTLTHHFLEALQNVTYKKHSSFGARTAIKEAWVDLALSHRNISPECLDSAVSCDIWPCHSKAFFQGGEFYM